MLQNQHAKTALYLRRSPEDKANRQTLFRGEKVTDSIENQFLELQQYAESKGFHDWVEYYDDNISGTTFSRPQFMEMLDEIQAGRIDTVIVKDLSRLGRDYIESGRYQEIVFPELGVRLIAVDDGYDSMTGAGTDMAPFKNLFNDYYVKDISKKTRSALKARATAGKYLGPGVYGYQKDPADKNRLIPDPETAPVVQRIFSMVIAGYSYRAIARTLSNEGVLSPGAYKGLTPRSNSSRPTDWHAPTISKIIQDQQYLGKIVYARSRKVSYKSKKVVSQPEESYIIVDNAHEPLISQADWDLANDIASRHRKTKRTGESHIFSGLLYCADCGTAMVHNGRNAFLCRRYKDYNKTPQGCTTHRIPDSFLCSAVWMAVKNIMWDVKIDRAALIEKLSGLGEQKKKEALNAARKDKRKIEKRLSEVGTLVKQAFEKNALGNLPDDIYKSLISDYSSERNELTARLELLTAQIDKMEQETGNAERFTALIEEYMDIEQLDRELVHRLIDRIEIGQFYTNNEGIREYPIDIYFRFVGNIKKASF